MAQQNKDASEGQQLPQVDLKQAQCNEKELKGVQSQKECSRHALTESPKKQKDNSQSPQSTNKLLQKMLKPDNLISQILDTEIYQLNKKKNFNPEFLRIKNNILLIILLLSGFGIYYLFEEFLDVMLLAFISGNKVLKIGVGYQQMRERFVKFVKEDYQQFFKVQTTVASRILQILAYVFLMLLLPWLRSMLGHPEQFWKHFVFSDFVYSFSFKVNPIVLCLQIFLFFKVVQLIFGPSLLSLIIKIAPASREFYKYTFGFIFAIVFILAISIIPSALVMEFSSGGDWIQKKVENHLGCKFMNYTINNNTRMPFCSQVFFKNSTFLDQTFKQFRAQSSDIEDCMGHLQQLEQKLIGYEFFHYQELACTWYLIVQKASAYFTLDTDVIATGTTFFKTIFGNIAFVLMSLSSIIFSVTTFITIFYMTVTYFNSQSNFMQDIFYGERKQLLKQITNLIQATLFIVVEHFLMSIILLELFDFSYFNMMISTFLSLMAFVPFFRPWFGALFICLIRSIFTGSYIINVVFLIMYYYLSEKIFSFRLREMSFHQIITNLSILFGIYQFGVAGIFYGPIIMILFKSVHRQLLRNQVYMTQPAQSLQAHPLQTSK